MGIHPRLSVSALSSWSWTVDQDLALWAGAGIDRVGLWADKLDEDRWDAQVDQVAAAGLVVANVIGASPFALDDPAQWEAGRDRLDRLFATAERLGAPVVATTTGPARGLAWDEAADALAEAARPVLAAHPGTALALEHTHGLRVDLGFAHTLADALDLAERVGATACMEVNACWAERDLAGTIARRAGRIGVVQVGDFVVGTRTTPDRVVPGDGDIPLAAIVGALLGAGYAGGFDLEVVGPRIEEEGYAAAIGRSVAFLGHLLDELGA